MTTIDKIRAAIERRIKSRRSEGIFDAQYGTLMDALCREDEYILSFLETLEPVTDSHDLEEAADNHIRKVADAAGHPGWDWETQDIAEAFIAGAQWRDAQIPKLPEGLDEAPAEIYVTMPGKKEIQDYVGAAWRTQEEGCEHIKYIRADLVYGGLDPELVARGHYYQPPGL